MGIEIRVLAVFGLTLLFGASSGCAHFRDGEVTTAPWPPPPPAAERTINVVITGNIGGELLQEFSTHTLRAYRDSRLFSRVTQSPRASEGLTAEIVVAHSGKGNMLLAMLTGLTLYIFPSTASDSFHVATTYRDADKNVLAQTTGTLGQTVWQQLFLVFAMPFARDESEEVFYDLARDSLIQASRANAL